MGYFDRAYYGFYATSWRMLLLIEGKKVGQLKVSVSVQIYDCGYAVDLIYSTLVGRNIINSRMWRGNKWSRITRWIGQTVILLVIGHKIWVVSGGSGECFTMMFLFPLPRGGGVMVNTIQYVSFLLCVCGLYHTPGYIIFYYMVYTWLRMILVAGVRCVPSFLYAVFLGVHWS